MIAEFTIETHLQKLDELTQELQAYRLSTTFEAFQRNKTLQYAILHLLHLAAEAMMTIGEMLISDESLSKPTRPRELFAILGRAGVIDAAFGEKLGDVVNFRNVLVHDYLKVDLTKAYAVLEHDLDDLDQFRTAIARYIQEHPQIS